MDQFRKTNPWISIWFRPRETVSDFIANGSEWKYHLLAAVSGVSVVLDNLSNQSKGDSIGIYIIFFTALLAGPFVGLISLHLWSILFFASGRIFKGKATLKELRAALSLSFIPTIWSLVRWLPLLYLYGIELFQSSTPRIFALPIPYFAISIIDIVISIWGLIILCKCISQVQKFSAWLSFACILTLSILFLVTIFLVWPERILSLVSQFG